MNVQLPDSVNSLQYIEALLLDIRAYAHWLSHASIKKRLRTRSKTEQPDISSAASELLHEWAVKKPLNTQSLDELITALESLKDTSPTLTIVLAAPASSGLKKTLVSWCRKNLVPNVLINFEFNATLLGGMVVRSGSHIYDWSFRRQILENRQKFPEVLRHV